MDATMGVKLLGVTLLLFTVTGINAQSDEELDSRLSSGLLEDTRSLMICGVAPLNSRIVGGQNAPEGAWPWQATVYVSGANVCGGTLINNQWVLTAAQCVQMTVLHKYNVSLGRVNQFSTNPNEVSRRVSRALVHAQYNSNTFDNDIALLQLSSPVNLNDYIRPVCLAAYDSEYKPGATCWVTGWGYIHSSGVLPQTLQEVTVPIVSNSDCKAVYSTLTDNMMCAGPSGGGRGACLGDAGGPLVRKYGSKWVQGGLISFISSTTCALPKKPGGYTRVSQYEYWIKSQIPTNQPGFVLDGTTPLVSLSFPMLLSIILVLQAL